MVIFMHLSREIDELLDYLIEQKNKLGKEKGKTQEILAEIKEIKAVFTWVFVG